MDKERKGKNDILEYKWIYNSWMQSKPWKSLKYVENLRKITQKPEEKNRWFKIHFLI